MELLLNIFNIPSVLLLLVPGSWSGLQTQAISKVRSCQCETSAAVSSCQSCITPDVRCRGSQHVEYRHSGCQSLDSDYTQTKLSCLHMSVMKTTGNLHRRGLYGNQRCQYSALNIKTECPRAEHFPQTCLHT